MFGKVRTKTLVIIVAIAIIAMIVIRSCYVCEGFVQGSFTREEAQKYFTPGSEQDSEKAYLANKVYTYTLHEKVSKKHLVKKENGEDDWDAVNDVVNKLYDDIFNQPNVDESTKKLILIAKQYGVTEQELGLYAKNDFVDIYAMKASSTCGTDRGWCN